MAIAVGPPSYYSAHVQWFIIEGVKFKILFVALLGLMKAGPFLPVDVVVKVEESSKTEPQRTKLALHGMMRCFTESQSTPFLGLFDAIPYDAV